MKIFNKFGLMHKILFLYLHPPTQTEFASAAKPAKIGFDSAAKPAKCKCDQGLAGIIFLPRAQSLKKIMAR